MATLWRHPYRETTLSPAVTSPHPDVILLELEFHRPNRIGPARTIASLDPGAGRCSLHNNEVGAMVDAFDHGAYDYVTKPCVISELAARLHAAYRRRTPRPPVDPVIDAASFSVDIGAQIVTRDGQRVALTATEWKVLEVLLRRRGTTVSARTLLCAVWGPAYTHEAHYVRIYPHRLRQKLERYPNHPRHLVTQARKGYRFVP
jgi:two-component system KDP operon response regulator KdpE